MKEERCILQIDKDPKAVIEPNYENNRLNFILNYYLHLSLKKILIIF